VAQEGTRVKGKENVHGGRTLPINLEENLFFFLEENLNQRNRFT
jgi:hypothetical protein